jgi:flagellar biosynthesis component FlhA
VVVADGLLALTASEAIQLDAAIQRHVIRNAEDGVGPPLVLVTVPRLRHALARLLSRIGHRLPVLSFTELEPDLVAVPGGLVDVALELEPPA